MKNYFENYQPRRDLSTLALAALAPVALTGCAESAPMRPNTNLSVASLESDELSDLHDHARQAVVRKIDRTTSDDPDDTQVRTYEDGDKLILRSYRSFQQHGEPHKTADYSDTTYITVNDNKMNIKQFYYKACFDDSRSGAHKTKRISCTGGEFSAIYEAMFLLPEDAVTPVMDNTSLEDVKELLKHQETTLSDMSWSEERGNSGIYQRQEIEVIGNMVAANSINTIGINVPDPLPRILSIISGR